MSCQTKLSDARVADLCVLLPAMSHIDRTVLFWTSATVGCREQALHLSRSSARFIHGIQMLPLSPALLLSRTTEFCAQDSGLQPRVPVLQLNGRFATLFALLGSFIKAFWSVTRLMLALQACEPGVEHFPAGKLLVSSLCSL